MDDRFLRTERLIGEDNLDRLRKSRVSVVGIGAVGGYLTEALARSGVGSIKIMDFDKVSLTNINRQIIADSTTIGKSKVSVMKERLERINPDIHITPYDMPLNWDNHPLLFDDSDIVVDCIDSLYDKVDLLEDAYKSKIDIVSSMGAALRKDISLIKRGDIFDTYGCPLAKAVRERLKKRGVKRGIECVFSSERVNFNYIDPSKDEKAEESARGSKRRVLGSLVTVTAVFGEYLAQIVLEHLLGKDLFTGISVK